MSALNEKLKGIRKSTYQAEGHRFTITYELDYGFKDGIEPFFLIHYKLYHDDKKVLESRNGKLSWVIPKGIEPLSNLMFVLMMDSLTNEFFVDMRLDEELRRGKKGSEKVVLLSRYKEHCHLLWNEVCDRYPEEIALLTATFLPEGVDHN
jgi:hypothetical protein